MAQFTMFSHSIVHNIVHKIMPQLKMFSHNIVHKIIAQLTIIGDQSLAAIVFSAATAVRPTIPPAGEAIIKATSPKFVSKICSYTTFMVNFDLLLNISLCVCLVLSS